MTKKTEVTPEVTVTPEVAVDQNDPRRMVKIKLPRDKNSHSKGIYVNVNNYNYFIPRGEEVEVPYFIAAVIDNSLEQDDKTATLISELSKGANY